MPLRRLRGQQPASRTAEDFWALRDVSMEIDEGEVVGIIGRNGAGKSTLLKILSRIAKPTVGRAEFRGRIGSLLEVGTGFHPELTGRENVYLNGAIIGMSRREIERRFDEIVEFSGVQEFLDTPVKRYSSGMQVRLAFAVSAHLDADILIVDEVLAVGDASFQRKCMGKMHGLTQRGRTVLFVSHNMPVIRSITDRCILLRNGQIAADGATSAVIDRYLNEAWDEAVVEEAGIEGFRRESNRDEPVSIRRIDVDGAGTSRRIRSGGEITIRCEIESRIFVPGACVAFALSNQQGERIATFLSYDQGSSLDLTPGSQEVTCRIKELPLTPGRYSVTLGVNRNSNSKALDVITDYPLFEVYMPEIENGQLEWPTRPWGCLHWSQVSWQVDRR
jgi:lipopolysaccharide transport system ATP-binding protein